MSKEKSFIGKLITGLLVIIVFLLAVAGVGVYYINKKLDVNVFALVRSVRSLNAPCEDTDFSNEVYTDEDMAGVKTETDKVLPDLISADADGNYEITPDKVNSLMSGDLKLTDKQMTALINYMFKSSITEDTTTPDTTVSEPASLLNEVSEDPVDPSPTPEPLPTPEPEPLPTPDPEPLPTPDPQPEEPAPTIDVKDLILNILEIKFSNITETSADIKIVVKINLGEFKKMLTDFPFSLINKHIPEKLYLTSVCTVTKSEEAFGYTVANKDFTVNKLTSESTTELFSLLNRALKTGASNDISVKMCDLFCQMIIKGQNDSGFAYSLSEAGATDYTFTTDGTNNYFVIKR